VPNIADSCIHNAAAEILEASRELLATLHLILSFHDT
jgi:hypothetical protein